MQFYIAHHSPCITTSTWRRGTAACVEWQCPAAVTVVERRSKLISLRRCAQRLDAARPEQFCQRREGWRSEYAIELGEHAIRLCTQHTSSKRACIWPRSPASVLTASARMRLLLICGCDSGGVAKTILISQAMRVCLLGSINSQRRSVLRGRQEDRIAGRHTHPYRQRPQR